MNQERNKLFVSLFIRHQQDLYRYILTLLANTDAAQDVLQETAMAIWEKFEEYDANEPFMPWALRFAYYKVLSYQKAERKHRHLDEDVIRQLSVEYPAPDQVDAQRTALAECMRRLNKSDRALIEFRYERQRSIVELAQAMGCTANALYKTLGRIRRALVSCVQKRVQQGGDS